MTQHPVAVVLAVPHSGNHTTVKFLEDVLGLTWLKQAHKYPDLTGDFIQHHPRGEVGIPLSITDAIIPIRHPYKTAISHTKWNQPPLAISGYWKGLISQIKNYNCYFLPIDVEEKREERLFQIANLFGKAHMVDEILAFAKEWPVCNKGDYDRGRQLTKNEKKDLKFAVDFYEEIMKDYTS